MNKTELIKTISIRTRSYQRDVKKVVDCMLETLTHSLSVGDEVKIAEFGTFYTVTTKPRTLYNPALKKHIQVPEKIVPKFKASKLLKNQIDDFAKKKERYP